MTLLGNLLLMATGGIVLVALLFMLGLWRTGDRFMQGLETMFNPPQPAPQVDIRSVVVRQIRDVSELTTTIFAMETVADASQDRTFGGLTVGSTRLLYIAFGEVRAGINLRELQPEDVRVIDDQTIAIRIPPPRILDSKIDVMRSRVYDYDRGFLGLGPDAPQLQTTAEQQALQQIVSRACEAGILNEANDKAQLAIEQLLTTAGYAEVRVETRAPPPGECVVQ
jgi:hypothetical protein